MKKIKLLTPLIGITTLSMAVMPLTSCNNGSGKKEEVKVSSITLDGKLYVLTETEYTYTAKVLPENATNKEVVWSIEIPTGSEAVATINNGVLKFTKHGTINLIATAKDGSGIKGSLEVIGLDKDDAQAVSKYYFCNDEWSEICTYANQGYDALLNHYSGLKLAGEKPFVGLARTITLNGQTHIVKVIDENHDDLADSNNKAVLTFELFTLFSGTNGYAITSKWDTNDNFDYTNSILRANLTGNGDESKKTWPSTALEILKAENSALYENLKTVKKEVATTDEYVVSTYSDKLFPLTRSEMVTSTDKGAKTEGSIYKYWSDNVLLEDRIKKDAKGEEQDYYWLTTPYASTKSSTKAWTIQNNGGMINDDVANENSVSFAFCI